MNNFAVLDSESAIKNYLNEKKFQLLLLISSQGTYLLSINCKL